MWLMSVQLLRTAGMLLLQREIPEDVNARVAAIAKEAGVPVLLDCGGVEGPIAPELMQSVTTLSPNETELARLTGQTLLRWTLSTMLPAIAPKLEGRNTRTSESFHEAMPHTHTACVRQEKSGMLPRKGMSNALKRMITDEQGRTQTLRTKRRKQQGTSWVKASAACW